jgi:hypothetical protein
MVEPAPPRSCMGICIAVRAFGIFAGLFLLVWLTTQILVGENQTFTAASKNTSQLGMISKNLPTVLTSVDQAVSMLTAIQLSAFIVVGFVLRETLTTARRPTREQLIAATAFIVCAFVSITLGYAARIQAIQVVNGVIDQTYAEFGAIETTVVRQALFVAVSAISAVYLVVVALFDTSGKLNSAEPAKTTDSTVIPAAPAPKVIIAGTARQDALGAEKGSP